jgi:two-component system chemotaxis response regulator CheB
MIRVLIAEDSKTVRQLLVSILTAEPEFQVVGEASNGVEAVELAQRLRPDVISMDIHMPVLDGFEATKEIMSLAPTPIVIVTSRAAHGDVELSLDATRAGALHVLRTPDSPGAPDFAARRAEFVSMLRAMAAVKVVRRRTITAAPRVPAPSGRVRRDAVHVIAIAASTGGPAALQQILMMLPRDFPLPILIVQHIAVGFCDGLADWFGRSSNLRVKVACHDEPLAPRTAYIAPDHVHLGVSRDARVILSDGTPIGGFRPSATYLFRTAASSFGAGVAAVILTGMGRDGVEGLREVRTAGGIVLAQDEASCVVYGMPGEAVRAGLVDEVLPVHAVAHRLAALVNGDMQW